MIRFDDPKLLDSLQKALDSLSIAKPTESLSAFGCILLKQVEEKLTTLTTVEPNHGVFTRVLHHFVADSWGDPGQEFLIDFDEFSSSITQLLKANSNNLLLELIEGQLVISANCYYVDGVKVQSHIRDSRLYPGDYSDFIVPDLLLDPSTLYSSISYEPFKLFVSTLRELGDFNEKFDFNGQSPYRKLILSVREGQLLGFTNNKNSQFCYCLFSQPCNTHQDMPDLTIEGRQLKRLFNLASPGESVHIYLSPYNLDNWITFQGDLGTISLKVYESDRNLKLAKDLFNFDPDHVHSSKLCSSLDLLNAFKAQKPSASDLFSDFLINEDNSSLFVFPVSSLVSNKRESNIPLQYTDNQGDWYLTSFNYSAIFIILSILVSLSKENYSISITQVPLQKPSGRITWLIFFSHVLVPSLSFLFFANDGYELLEGNVD